MPDLSYRLPGPESGTDAFMRITFARYEIGAGAFGRAPPGKTRHRQVEASPEKMDRAALADEMAAKFLKYGIHTNQYPPECVREHRVVGLMRNIFGKGNRTGHFIGSGVDLHIDRHGV